MMASSPGCMRKKYVKPTLELIQLRPEESIAGPEPKDCSAVLNRLPSQTDNVVNRPAGGEAH